MSVSVYEWFDRVVLEGIKFVILAHCFFGYEYSRKKSRFLLVLYLLLIPVVDAWARYVGALEIVYTYGYLVGILLLLFLFEGEAVGKIKAFFLIWVLISFADTVVATPFFMFTTVSGQDVYMMMCIGCISDVLWILLGWKAKKLQKRIQEFWKELSFREYGLLLGLLIIASALIGGYQLYLYELISMPQKEIVFLLVLLAMAVSIVICIWLFYTRQSKDRLEEINRLSASNFELQEKYYEDSLRQYEDMRSFRHDINNHIYMLSELSRQDKTDELKDYVAKMAESYRKIRTIHTGNFIADCIISHTRGELQGENEVEFQLDGQFPKKFFMENIDFCILLSNVLDNAREALGKVEGKRLLHIEVKRYNQWFFLIVRNSVAEENIDFEHTSKPDGNHHGYGTQNIRRVVEKYNGTVQWRLEQGMAVVLIKFERDGEEG